MSNGDGTDYLRLFWDIAKYVLSAMWFVLGGGGLWVLRRYHGDRSMLQRHDELHTQYNGTMGELAVFRKTAERGPIGEELETELKLLHRRASNARKLAEETKAEANTRFASIEADLKWIKDALVRIENK